MNYSALDRFNDTLTGQPMDRVPVFAGVSLWAAANYPDAPFQEISSDPDLIVKAQLWAREEIGSDILYNCVDAMFIAEAFGCEVRFTDTGPLVEPLPLELKSLEDLGKISLPNPRESGRMPVVLEATEKLRDITEGKALLLGVFEGPFTNTCRIIEVEHILRMTFKNSDLLDLLLDRVCDSLIAFGQAIIERGVNVLFLPEPTASATMISPSMFRRFVLPRLQKVTRELSVPIILHICGDTKPILSPMAEAGAEILSLDQCMDLAEAWDVVKDLVLAGNVDPVKSLLMGSPEDVEADSLNCLRKGGTHRFILMPGCGVPPNTPTENLRAMVRTAERYGLGEK